MGKVARKVGEFISSIINWSIQKSMENGIRGKVGLQWLQQLSKNKIDLKKKKKKNLLSVKNTKKYLKVAIIWRDFVKN